MLMLYYTRNDATSSIKSLFEVDLIKNSRYQFLPNLVLSDIRLYNKSENILKNLFWTQTQGSPNSISVCMYVFMILGSKGLCLKCIG